MEFHGKNCAPDSRISDVLSLPRSLFSELVMKSAAPCDALRHMEARAVTDSPDGFLSPIDWACLHILAFLETRGLGGCGVREVSNSVLVNEAECLKHYAGAMNALLNEYEAIKPAPLGPIRFIRDYAGELTFMDALSGIVLPDEEQDETVAAVVAVA